MNQAFVTKLRLCLAHFCGRMRKKRIEKVIRIFLGLFRYIQKQNPSLDFHHVYGKHLCAEIDLVALIVIIVRFVVGFVTKIGGITIFLCLASYLHFLCLYFFITL